MTPNPFLGVLLHWTGGLAAASFYIPYKQVRRWSWETYWLAGGFFSWIIMPALMASLLVPGVWSILAHTPIHVLFWAFLFGMLWGVGGLTFGLTMRYLGIALGMAVALGYTAVFGTMIPPIFHGQLSGIFSTLSGKFILLGVFASVIGIGVSGMAGMSKERELTTEQKQSTITEFHFGKGMAIATFSGIMSSCMAFGLDAGKPINDYAVNILQHHGRSAIWQGLPVLIPVLLGGFVTNFVWCAALNIKNRSGREYLGVVDGQKEGASLIANNYLFSAMAGITWYLQFFFYTMGQSKMGSYSFSSWTLHMASIMIFSMLWGIALKEWKGTSKRTHWLIALGLAVLVSSTVIIGYGNYLNIPK